MAVEVILYTRDGCGLCDEARARLLAMHSAVPLRLIEVDITQDVELEKALFERIPVVEIGGVRVEAPLDWEAVGLALIAATSRGKPVSSSPKPKVTGWRRSVVIALDRAVLGFARRWVAVLTVFVGLYAGIPFVAPIAMHVGATNVANVIYKVYSPVCHQFAFRSWFLFGEQTVYPRERTGLAVGSFEQYARAEPAFSGVDVRSLDAGLIYAAKQFVGNEQMGWKVAFCQRDVAIYAAIALFGVVFIALKGAGVAVPKLPFWAYLLLAIAPIGLDGFSQYFANPPFNGFGLPFYPARESLPFLRALTGGLFGLGNAWLAYPYIEDSMQETAEMVERKLVNAGVIEAS